MRKEMLNDSDSFGSEDRRMKSLKPATLLVALLLAFAIPSHADVPKDPKERLAKAEAMFQERCKKAGKFIYRTAENVEGVFLLKVRPKGINRGDQYRLDDPYGSDLGGDGYLMSFLRGYETRQAQFAPGSPPRLGYHYVDAIDPKDGKRYRYTGSRKDIVRTSSILMGGDGKTKFTTKDFVLDRVIAPDPAPRYGVTFEDISTTEERDYWIAGSSLKVIDLQTNEVMAERIGYMMDPGQGNDSGARAPWLLAADNACPHFFINPNLPPKRGHGANAQSHQTENFVEGILKPKLDN